MTSATNPATDLTPFPDHTQLPESDGTYRMHNFDLQSIDFGILILDCQQLALPVSASIY
ncbi:hypothetical protein GNE10_22560 [Nostoc sp. 2RC]|nr:hypothetical protein [Nostoc sp. 2RC]MBC1239882.1 hypothetical protein [Nostoc sp. 2RC]